MTNVTSIFGEPVADGKANEACVEELERLLECAKRGEVIGFAGTYMMQDYTSNYLIAGLAGGFGMLGAVEMIKAELIDINRDYE